MKYALNLINKVNSIFFGLEPYPTLREKDRFLAQYNERYN